MEEYIKLTREQELLIATWKLLNRQNESVYVLNMLEQTVYYDETACDGNCLIKDIEACLFEVGIELAQ